MNSMNVHTATPARLSRRSLMAMACAAAPAPAFSQTAAAAPAASAATDADSVQSVVVSGSRIKHDVFSSAAPVQIIKTEDAALSGFTTIGEVLQSTAVTGGQGQINNAYGGYVTDGGPGANTVGLRGLAPTRTLILLNGRRLPPSGTRGSVGSVDLNMLPTSVVERVEILKDGASSIYGSDAIAGVINIITKRDVSEITVDGGMSQTQHGGGDKYNFALSGGHVFEHAHFLAAYTFSEQQALSLGQRGWTRCNTDYVRTSGASGVGAWGSGDYVDPNTGKPKCYPITGTGDNGVTINTIGTSAVVGQAAAGAPNGAGQKYNRWRPNSSVTTGVVGYEGVSGGSLNVRDTFDPRVLNNSLMSPVRNHNVYAQGGFDLPALGDTAEVYWEAMYNRRESSEVGFRQLSLDYEKGSPLIPSNLAFSTFAPAGSSLINNGLATGVRAFIGSGNSHSSQDVNFHHETVGLRGTFNKINWDYDISLTHGESRGTYTVDGFLTDRLAQSLDVISNGAGGYNCTNPSNGCVAAPALTSAVVGGKLPANWLAYVYDSKLTGLTKYKEDVLTASTTGDLYTLPYGKVKGAFGAEIRRNFIDDLPSQAQRTNDIYNYSTSTQTRGSDQAKDIFAEVEVPLLKNLPFARELTVNGSVRRADYRSYGAGFTHKFGLLYAPVKWLSLRGTDGTSYRAPALFEQYVGATTGYLSSSGDPCNDAASKGGALAANCAAQGLAGDFSQTASIASITSGGRAAGLKAETSRNSSVGAVLQPALPAGWGEFSFALDHFNITINNGIDQVGTANILSMCYDSVNLGSAYCRLITRNATTKALTVNNSYVNVATNVTRGNDFNLAYANDVGIGRLTATFQATQFLTQATKLFADDGWDDVNGNVGSPKWSGVLDLGYAIRNWGFHYGTEWVGKTSSYSNPLIDEDPATSIHKYNTPDYFLQNASVTYKDAVGKWKATFGVRNLFDRNPPSISAGYYNRVGNAPLYSGYDYFGRTFFLSGSKSF
jgi:outer membrane receptor protein involved in Fe transport